MVRYLTNCKRKFQIQYHAFGKQGDKKVTKVPILRLDRERQRERESNCIPKNVPADSCKLVIYYLGKKGGDF